MSKNLTFKLILDGDNKGLISAAKQSETTVKSVLETIKTEAEKIKIDALVGELAKATTEISSLGDKSAISATQLRDMSTQSQQMISGLKSELIGAQVELVRLSQTNASPADIQNAINRVEDLKSSIQTVETAFGAYESVATNAMTGVDKAASKTIAEVQKFTSVDLNNVVSEAQSATRAIESMGDGAVVSSQEIERISQLGANSISTLEKELQQATTELKNLSQSTSAVPLEKFNEASNRVAALEDALSLTQTAFKDFQTKASSAMHEVSDSTNKAADSAKKAGNDIYSALGIRPPTVINDAINDLKSTLENFKANSKLPAEEVERVTKITEQQIEKLKSELNGVEPATQKANSGISNLSKGVESTKFAFNALAGAMAALGVGFGVKELAQTADSYTNLSARINIATQDGGNFAQAMAGVHQVALATNSSLEATGTLFTKINDTGKQMGLTQQQSLDLTKTINQAIQTGGGSAQASEAAITQLAQALQSGVLRGDEFNSIMEQAPGLTKALASGLNVTTGELRKMAENGELSAERVVKAIQSQSAAVQADYDKFPTTIGNALQRISTSWEILIGKMDQANGTSSIAAQWLSTLADNLNLLEPIIEDIGNGFVRFGEYYSNIYDQGAIDSLKTALVNIYETIKTLFNTVMDVGEAFHDVFSDALSSVFGFSDGLYPAGQQVSGFQKFIDLLNIAISFLNDGFKTIGIGVNLFTGTLYGLAAVWYELKSVLSWGSVKEEAIANMQAMQAKSQEYFDKGFDGVKNFGSKTIETIREIGKTDEQKNQDRIASNQKALDELKTQEEKHKTDYKSISDQRIQLEQQLQDARRAGNQTSIDLATKGLADLDAKEKSYQAESKKIQDAKIQAAQAIADAMVAANGKISESELKVLNAKLAAQGLKAEFDGAGKAIVSAMNAGTEAVQAQDNSLTKARQGAQALGLDLDVALNRVSEKFAANRVHLDNYANGLTDMGVKGEQATDALYQGWEKWAEAAKNQAEIDAAKAKLLEFEKQGVFSTKQVQIGMEYLDQVNGKIPENISEVEKAYKMLGVTSREEATKIADSQMRAFNVMKQSGTASAEQIRTALINMAEKIYASGDAAKTAWYEGQLAANGLSSTVNEAGKQVVSANDQMTASAQRHASTVSSTVTGAYRQMGAVAREEAKNSIDAWNEAMNVKSETQAKAREEDSKKTHAVSSTSYTKSYVRDELKKMGYDDTQAEKIAQSIFGTALAKDQDTLQKNRSTGGLTDVSSMLYQELRKKGLAGYDGSRYIEQALQRYSDGYGQSTMQSLAPQVYSTKDISSIFSGGAEPAKQVQYNLNFNGKSVTLNGNASQENMLNELFNQLEVLKKSS